MNRHLSPKLEKMTTPRCARPFPWKAILVMMLVMAGMGVSMLFAYTPEQAVFYPVAKWVLVPWLVILAAGALGLVRHLDLWKEWAQCGVVLLVLTVIFLTGACAAVNVVNAAFPTGRDIVLRGPVIWLRAQQSKGMWSYRLTVHDEATQKDVTLQITQAEYQGLGLGSCYEKRMHEGCLGIPFLRRW